MSIVQMSTIFWVKQRFYELHALYILFTDTFCTSMVPHDSMHQFLLPKEDYIQLSERYRGQFRWVAIQITRLRFPRSFISGGKRFRIDVE